MHTPLPSPALERQLLRYEIMFEHWLELRDHRQKFVSKIELQRADTRSAIKCIEARIMTAHWIMRCESFRHFIRHQAQRSQQSGSR